MRHDVSDLEERLLVLLHAVREEGYAQARAELNELLRTRADARVTMARLLVDEQALIGQLRDECIVATLDEHSDAKAPAMELRAHSARRWLLPLAAAAAVTVAGLTARFWPRSADPVAAVSGAIAHALSQVAVVTQVVDAQWNAVEFQTNDRVPVGKFSLKAGLVQLQFLSGATVVIEGPAELDLTSERGGEVLSGLVSATVPPVAEGFTLVAAGWRAVDRGTVFGIDARSPEQIEVHVIDGKLDMHHGADTTERETFSAGQAARLTASALVEQPAAVSRIPSEADVVDRAARAMQGEFERWEVRSDALSAEPGLVLCLDFESTDAGRGVIRNRAPQADPPSHASVIGAEWTQGRWPSECAVAFQRVGDLIRSSLRTHLDAGAFAVSLGFDAESGAAQTILLSPSVGPGQIYWLYESRNRPRREIGFHLIKTDAQRRNLRFVSQRVLQPPEIGRWHTLAVIHDPSNHRVRHYQDGELIKEDPLNDDPQLNLGQLVIGNWGFPQSRATSQDAWTNSRCSTAHSANRKSGTFPCPSVRRQCPR